MIRPRRSSFLWSLALAVLIAAPLHAQGSLSVQGLGYPPGQLSARAKAAGGALGEVDPHSPLNPATILGFGGSTLYLQAEPEYRRVRAGSVQASTTTARFPLIAGAFNLGSRWAIGLAASTLSDRTWSTTLDAVEQIGSDTARARSTYQSEGAINDLRLGAAFGATPWLRVGVGAHALTGRNQIFVGRNFTDARYADFADTSTISYAGHALSAGAEALIARLASVAVSYRRGGQLRASSSAGDTTIGRGNAPDRLGVAAAYRGIANSVIAISAAREGWSTVQGLGGSRLRPRDTWDFGLGGDVVGPRFGQRVVMLRAGVRRRDLPFAVVDQAGGSAEVQETSFSGGFGTLFGNGRAALDLGVIRASRDIVRGVTLDASERAWIISVGLTVRP